MTSVCAIAGEATGPTLASSASPAIRCFHLQIPLAPILIAIVLAASIGMRASERDSLSFFHLTGLSMSGVPPESRRHASPAKQAMKKILRNTYVVFHRD